MTFRSEVLVNTIQYNRLSACPALDGLKGNNEVASLLLYAFCANAYGSTANGRLFSRLLASGRLGLVTNRFGKPGSYLHDLNLTAMDRHVSGLAAWRFVADLGQQRGVFRV